MKNPLSLLPFSMAVLACAPGPGSISAENPTDALIDRELGSLIETYKMLHAAPELSRHEEKTSAFIARELRAMGYTVTDHIGKFAEPNAHGYGVVALLSNGKGPTVWVRSELDALPVEEKTGLPYASRVKVMDDAGQEVGVMHACGHDLHMTSLLGSARLLAQLRDRWRGTLVIVAQPAEETVEGARAMLKDGLFTRFPRPDFAIALHDMPGLEAGRVGMRAEYMMASNTSVDITMRGVGSHGARPELSKDPIVASAELVLALQTIVSREVPPTEPAVVTVGSIHGGTKHNIIPDEVHLQLTVRTFKEEVRKKILGAIERIAMGVARTAGIPDTLAPIVKVSETEFTPATYNNPALTARLTETFKKALGESNVLEWPPMMVAEDFGLFTLENHEIPICLFWLGASDPDVVRQSREGKGGIYSLHSSKFAPAVQPALRTGI
ncbi:MAG TPA: amidohydrolase, partial [Bacteroidota bacterium]